jgi:hypothetical protein
LKGVDSESVLPIWVGTFAANAIALEIEKVAPQRPMTHALLRNLILQMGLKVDRVVISDLVDNTFFATIEMTDSDGGRVILDARPSDAIALALRADCAIFAEQKVIDVSSSSSRPEPPREDDSVGSPEEWPDLIG